MTTQPAAPAAPTSDDAEPGVDLHWGRFTLIVLAALAWMVLGAVGSRLFEAADLTVRLAGAALLVGPLAVGYAVFFTALRGADELGRRHLYMGVAMGASFGLVWGVVMAAQYGVMGTSENAVALFGVIPGMSALFAAVMVQVNRYTLARAE